METKRSGSLFEMNKDETILKTSQSKSCMFFSRSYTTRRASLEKLIYNLNQPKKIPITYAIYQDLMSSQVYLKGLAPKQTAQLANLLAFRNPSKSSQLTDRIYQLNLFYARLKESNIDIDFSTYFPILSLLAKVGDSNAFEKIISEMKAKKLNVEDISIQKQWFICQYKNGQKQLALDYLKQLNLTETEHWNLLLLAYTLDESHSLVLNTLEHMYQYGPKLNMLSFETLMVYFRRHQWHDKVEGVFQESKHLGVPKLYNLSLSSLNDQRRYNQVLGRLIQMKNENIDFDHHTFEENVIALAGRGEIAEAWKLIKIHTLTLTSRGSLAMASAIGTLYEDQIHTIKSIAKIINFRYSVALVQLFDGYRQLGQTHSMKAILDESNTRSRKYSRLHEQYLIALLKARQVDDLFSYLEQVLDTEQVLDGSSACGRLLSSCLSVKDEATAERILDVMTRFKINLSPPQRDSLAAQYKGPMLDRILEHKVKTVF